MLTNQKDNIRTVDHVEASNVEAPLGSNAVRLSGWQWIVAGAIVVAAFCAVPASWERIERFEPDSDYRIPYDLSNDYWLFARWCRLASARCKTLVIGDSVVWGQYVEKDQTLSHYLNELAGGSDFANMGVDGAHPVALAGLLEYYGRDISGKSIVLHCNPLWMSSKKHDLQIEKEFRFNHPRLAPQFTPNIPCYMESYSNRLGIVLERNVSFFGWVKHLQFAYFDKMDIPAWTLEHPYDNPLKAITLVPVSGGKSRFAPVSWTERGAAKQNFPWTKLETSLQWRFFRRSVEILKRRGNKVFVLVGPLNEHMLKQQSLETYTKRKRELEAWLQEKKIPYYLPPALPSDYYADASHPLSRGYRMLAQQLLGKWSAYLE